MNADVKAALENLDASLNRLESAIEQRLETCNAANSTEPDTDQIGVDRQAVAQRLDGIIHRLESVLEK